MPSAAWHERSCTAQWWQPGKCRYRARAAPCLGWTQRSQKGHGVSNPCLPLSGHLGGIWKIQDQEEHHLIQWMGAVGRSALHLQCRWSLGVFGETWRERRHQSPQLLDPRTLLKGGMLSRSGVIKCPSLSINSGDAESGHAAGWTGKWAAACRAPLLFTAGFGRSAMNDEELCHRVMALQPIPRST